MAPHKGKQGTKGSKQIYAENAETLVFYRNMLLGCYGIYFLLSYIFGPGVTFGSGVLFVFSIAANIGSYQVLRFIAKPKLSEADAILDPGIDLNMENGIAEQFKDVIILTSGCQVLSVISSYFWLLWLLVPLKGAYMAWTKVIAPWIFAPPPEPSQNEEKKLRKMERRMKR